MNNLQIFKSEDFGEIRVTSRWDRQRGKRYFLNGMEVDRFELLAAAADADSEKEAWDIMNIASTIFHTLGDRTFNSLYGSVAIDIARRFQRNEFYYHEIFKKNISKVLGADAKVVKRKNNSHNFPDVWMQINNQYVPVEIKLHDFDLKALNQLSRYMNVYNCAYGIASAERLVVELPSNITFVSFKDLEKGIRDKL